MPCRRVAGAAAAFLQTRPPPSRCPAADRSARRLVRTEIGDEEDFVDSTRRLAEWAAHVVVPVAVVPANATVSAKEIVIRARGFRVRRAVTTAAAVLVAGPGVVAPASAAPVEPPLRVVAGSSSVTVERVEGDSFVFLDLGVQAITGANPFEVRVTRRSYAHPIVATQYLRRGGAARARRLPDGLLNGFAGLPGFLHVTLTNPAGEVVARRDHTFCPNSFEGGRIRPEAPATSPFPQYCGNNPFTLGAVWGIQAGWSAPTTDFSNALIQLADGQYTAKVTVAQRYRDLFGIPDTELSIEVTVTTNSLSSHQHGTAKTPAHIQTHAHAHRAHPAPNPVPNRSRPTGPATVPTGRKPDLVPLPAWSIFVTDEDTGDPSSARQYLTFNANVWNAGPSPLVVDGFRRPGQNLMDAYQYFYDNQGRQIGYTPAGTLEWDSRDGHHHWHFTDFASYQLLNESQEEVVRSQKEAFCLVPTDPIDLTIPNANWKPFNTDLNSACGQETSLSIREVLDTGHGDTYQQYLPGQAFDITDLPNGTYYIQVTANPEHQLHESDTTNNVSRRQVILGGTSARRTVDTPPYQLIHAP
jgi:hypothetical protein